jgi:glutamyl-tRNA reductase
VKILLVGMNHRTAPVEVRERFVVDDYGEALRKLAGSDEIEEAVLISTCNRVEVAIVTHNPAAARLRLEHFLHVELGDGGARIDDHLYEYIDHDAIAHVFRVASSIDSMVIGEPQILGQMKDAYRQALESGACGAVLSRLFQRAFATAKRVKNETRIAQRPVSVARVAVDLARQIFEDLGNKQALMIGAGEMIEMALFALQREGLGGQRVANRTRSRAEALANRFGASAHGLDELDALLVESDVVLTCIGGDEPVLTHDQIGRVLKARRSRPIFLIDMGVPRNIDPAVNGFDNAYLYDIDDLHGVAAANEQERRRESLAGERIVLEEQERFTGWMVALQAVPTIRHLRARAEAIRIRELERAVGRLGLSEAQADGVEALTRGIVNKLLHPPLTRLGAQTDREEGLAILEEARALFGLDDPTAPGAEIDPLLLSGWSPGDELGEYATRAPDESAIDRPDEPDEDDPESDESR